MEMCHKGELEYLSRFLCTRMFWAEQWRGNRMFGPIKDISEQFRPCISAQYHLSQFREVKIKVKFALEQTTKAQREG